MRGAPQFQHTEELRARGSASRFAIDSHSRARAIIILCIIYVIPRASRVQCGSTNQNALLMQIVVAPRSLGVNSQSATGNNHNDQ